MAAAWPPSRWPRRWSCARRWPGRSCVDTLWRQALLLLVITAVVVWVVQRATRPVREISAQLVQRSENDLAPIAATRAPRELLPLVDATNQVMARLAHLLAYQKRFVRDTSHQLRTPLAVLRTQLQSAQRGDVDPAQALQEMSGTVERATLLANQMLALAKVEQLRQQGEAPVVDWAEIVRAVALDLAPLIAQQQLDFDIDTVSAPVRGHEWALRELTRNLLHNAIKLSRPRGRLAVRLSVAGSQATLRIADSGPGITPELRRRLFQPFASGDPRSGSGPGPGHLPGDRRHARRRDPARQPRRPGPRQRAGRHRQPAAGGQSGRMTGLIKRPRQERAA